MTMRQANTLIFVRAIQLCGDQTNKRNLLLIEGVTLAPARAKTIVRDPASGTPQPSCVDSRQKPMSLKVLFIGGTGNISLPCVAEAGTAGHRVSVFNRGKTSVHL